VSGAHGARLLAVAKRLADEYRKDPGVVAVLVAGSAGTGEADDMSDLDLVVLWSHAPSDDARRAPIEAVDGEIEDIAPFEEEEWAESFAVGDVHVGTSMFLADTLERYLDELLLRADPTDNAQILVAALQEAIVLHGEELVAAWRERAATYPEALARAVAAQSLQWQGGWGSAVAFAARRDLVPLGSVVDPAIRALLRLLLALNRRYLSHPRFKRWRILVRRLRIAPLHVEQRLDVVLGTDPRLAVLELQSLLEEAVSLAERELPGIDTSEAREWISFDRHRLPPATG
jgi:predicted nucleotidyltransferase